MLIELSYLVLDKLMVWCQNGNAEFEIPSTLVYTRTTKLFQSSRSRDLIESNIILLVYRVLHD